MTNPKIVSRITKLLRIAHTHKNEPLGTTSQAIAETLMRKHGIRVELEDEKVWNSRSHLLFAARAPNAWREWLGETLAAVYRCDLTTCVQGGRWQLWIYSHSADRVTACRNHFEFLEAQIQANTNSQEQALIGWSGVFVVGEKPRNKTKAESSYGMGLTRTSMAALLEDLGYHGPLPFEIGFDPDDFKELVKDPFEVDEAPLDAVSLTRYVHTEPVDVPKHLQVTPNEPDMVEPILIWFRRGMDDSPYVLRIPANLEDVFGE